MTAVSKQVAQQIQTAWAIIPALAGIQVRASEAAVGALGKVSAVVRMDGYEKAPEAIRSHRIAKLKLQVFAPNDNADFALDALEDVIQLVLNWLDVQQLVKHEGADFAQASESGLFFYSIPLTTYVSK